MTLVCPEWHQGINWNNGDELGDVYGNNVCSFWDTGTVYLDEHGYVRDNQYDGHRPRCGEHADCRAYEYDDLWEGLVQSLRNAGYLTCEEHDAPQYWIVFRDQYALDEHVADEHGEEPTEAELTRPTPPTQPAALPEHWDHPDLQPWQRELINAWLQGHEPTVFPGWSGILVPTRLQQHLRVICISRQRRDLNEAAINEWRRNWPEHFFMYRDDPHFQTGRSSHAAWS